jgi:hypothetical protein
MMSLAWERCFTMSRDWYFVVGLAKTGTTSIAMTLANTLGVSDVLVEPKELATIERYSAHSRMVIKIIFDHWQTRSESLRDVVTRTVERRTPTTVLVVRDPRDEAVSRLHYAAFEYFSRRSTTEQDREAWVDMFRRKEASPKRIGLLDMQSEMLARFGVGFLPGRTFYESYYRFIEDVSMRDSSRVHLLRYEEFVGGTIQHELLRRLLSGSRDVGPTFRRVFRSGSSGDWQAFFTNQDDAFVTRVCEPILTAFGYPLERSGTFGQPSRTTGSDYVARLIDEARSVFEKAALLRGRSGSAQAAEAACDP